MHAHPKSIQAAILLLHLAAVALAQSPVLLQCADTAAKSAASLTMALPNATSPGSLLVVCCATTSSQTPALNGGGASQWTLCRSQIGPSGSLSIWAGRVDTTISRTVTVAFPGAQPSCKATVGEWQGLLGPLQFAATSASGSSTNPNATVSLPPLPTARGDLVVAAIEAPGADEVIPALRKGWKPILSPTSDPSWFLASGWLVAESTGPASLHWDFRRAQDHAAVAVAFRAGSPPTAAPTLRQHASNQLWSVSSMTVQLPNPPLPGNLLVLCHESNSSANSRIQGGGVPAWTLCASSAPAIVNSEIWAGIVGDNPSGTIAIALGSSPNGAIANVSEWSGMPTPLAFEAAIGSGPTGGTSARTPTVRADANELVIAMSGIHQGSNTISAPGQGFTELMQGYLPSTAQSAAYRVPQQSGQVYATWQLAYSTRWAAPIVVFGGM